MIIIGKRHKPLLALDHEKLVTCCKQKIYILNIKSKKQRLICTLPGNIVIKLLSRIRIFERLFRGEVKCAARISAHQILIIYKKTIYRINLHTKEISVDQKYNRKNNAFRISKIQSIDGFENGIAYGEYFSNEQRKEPVAIYFRDDATEKWKKAFEFPKGKIRHIHNLIPDYENKCVYILTGDFGNEAGIWIAKDNFRNVKPLLIGKQIYRSVQLFRYRNYLIYATDTAKEDNYIMLIDPIKGRLQKILIQMSGSCLNAVENMKDLYFSTTVEGDETIRGWRAWFSRKRGSGIKSDEVYLKAVSKKDLSIKTVLKMKRDAFPPKLFQYSQIQLLSMPDGTILMYPIAVKKYDGKLIILNK